METHDEREKGSSAPRDLGTTFIEILIAIVLLGIGGVVTMTALSVSIQGSDQHRSKVNAVAELEGAGAYLARTEFNADCSSPPTASALETSLGGRPGANNSEISLSVTNIDCSAGLPLISIQATSSRGHAVESLDVVIGGISVLKPEGVTAGPGPTCTWGTLTAAPTSVNVHTSGPKAGELKSNATISLSLTFSGTCTGPVLATITSAATGPFSKQLTQDPSNPQLLNAVLAKDEISWQPDTYTVSVPPSVTTQTVTFVVG